MTETLLLGSQCLAPWSSRSVPPVPGLCRRAQPQGLRLSSSFISSRRWEICPDAQRPAISTPGRELRIPRAHDLGQMATFLFDEGAGGWAISYLSVMKVLLLLFGVTSIWNEALGKNPATYSKFAEMSRIKGKTLPSRDGWIVVYSPAALVALLVILWDLVSGANPSTRFWLVVAGLAVHFSKRTLEGAFLHRFSGVIEVETMIIISVYYTLLTGNLILGQQLAESMPSPSVNTLWLGLPLFVLGMLGNFYHHILLRNLRSGGSKKYVVPQGGLFPVFVAPHYICELVEFFGLALMCQTVFSIYVAGATLLYLGSRSYSTKLWYRKKIEDFPANRCAIIPGIL